MLFFSPPPPSNDKIHKNVKSSLKPLILAKVMVVRVLKDTKIVKGVILILCVL